MRQNCFRDSNLLLEASLISTPPRHQWGSWHPCLACRMKVRSARENQGEDCYVRSAREYKVRRTEEYSEIRSAKERGVLFSKNVVVAFDSCGDTEEVIGAGAIQDSEVVVHGGFGELCTGLG
eukprot:scaffold112195_cov21-Tisochrysis_lutea.AAC.1